MKLVRPLILVAIPLGGISFATWYFTRPEPVMVVLHAVERGTVQETIANTRAGTVMVRRRARLAPSLGGQVAVLNVREGDTVKKGQLLLQLWNDDVHAELALAKSEHQQAIAQAEDACLRAELAEREAERQLALQEQGIAAAERVDRAVSGAQAARALCRASEAEQEVRRKRIKVVEARLAKTILTAPFAGIVAEVNAELGEFVTPSPTGIPTPPAVDLIDRTSIYVSAPIDEVDAAAVRPGMDVQITVDAFGDRVFAGVVKRVSPYVLDREKQARTVDVEVEFVIQEEAALLLPGYSADVEVVLSIRADHLRVPSEAVFDVDKVLVLDDATGLLQEKTFAPGIASWRWTEVLSGLEEGQQFVISLDREGVAPGVNAMAESTGPIR